MNPWIYEIIENLDEASEPDLLRVLDEFEYRYDALGDMDRDIAEGLIGRLNRRLDALRRPS